MRTQTTSHHLLRHFVLGVLAASLCAQPARAQYVATAATNLSQPAGVAVDGSGNLYVTDPGNFRIAKFVPSSGALTTLAGSPGNYGAAEGTGTAATFFIPQGIVAARGGLVVADQGSQLIRYVTFGGTVTDLAGQAFVSGNANGQGTNATFSYPEGIAADGAGNLYVADSQNNAIREIDTNNNVSTVPVGGYVFDLPNAVAVDDNDNLWVADSGHDVICLVSNGAVTVVAGVSGHPGTNDSLTAASALFNSPSGLLWDANNNRLLISDAGNDTIRGLFLTNYNGSIGYAVETLAGLPDKPGNIDGTLAVAQFSAPIGLSFDPTDIGFYVADSGNNAVRVLQATEPLPPVSAPIFGYVSFPADADPPYTSVFVDSSSAIFNNITNLAIEAEQGTETYISYGPTGSVIPQPGPRTETAPIYPGDGAASSQISSAISPGPGTNDITIYAIGVQSGRRSSPVVSARFQFVTANPVIVGDNAADVLLTDITLGSDMYYTIDGSSPTNDGSSLGPVGSGSVLSLDIQTNVLLQVRAFTPGLATSQLISTELSVSNVVGNQLTWGFASGLASTHYITGLNLGFSAPVTFTGIPSSLPIYTMQFDLTVTNNGPTPPPPLSAGNFVCHLLQPDPAPPDFKLLPPGIFDNLTDTTNVGISATQPDSLELAWLVTPPVSNLYTSTYLLQYSGIFETLLILPPDGTLLGELQFFVPPTSTPGTPYTLRIGAPSASSYTAPECCGPPINVLVQALTNGETTGTSLNAVKLVTVLTNNSPASAHLVGDVFPFNWFNIGDFGDSTLLDDDVIQTMEFAFTDPFALPANNPYFNAMDSSDGTINNFFSSSDATIDLITNGDGFIDVSDVYVTLRRSLDPGLVNYSRYWSGTAWVPTVFPGSVQQSNAKSSPLPHSPVKLALGAPQFITVAADQIQAGANRTVQVPIRVLAAANLPVRVFMFNAVIQPLDGSPAITTAVSFSAATNLGSPYATASQSLNSYGAAWLDSSVPGVSGTAILGTLTVTLPPNVNANSAYLVHFTHFSASPNGLASFRATVQDGLITVGNRTGSSWGDGIPDTWRLLYFGTIYNILSAADADPDGDGASNWQEYIAGTNPRDAASVFRFLPAAPLTGTSFTLQWPSVVNKIYTLESSSSPGGGWTTVATNLLGNSQVLQWTDTNAASSARFYRALVQ
jgi:sugar lactone lactonase YvrE